MNVQSQSRFSVGGITLVGLGLLSLIHQFVLEQGMSLAHDLSMAAIFAFLAAMAYLAYTQDRQKRWLLLVSWVTGIIAGISLLETFFSSAIDVMQVIPLIMIGAGITILSRQLMGKREAVA